MAPATDLQTLFEQRVRNLDTPAPLTFAEIQELIYEARYCGPIVLHVRNGRPEMIELGRPVKIDLSGRRPGG